MSELACYEREVCCRNRDPMRSLVVKRIGLSESGRAYLRRGVVFLL